MHPSHPSGGRSGGGFRTAFLLNLDFTGLELVVVLLTNSVAILSDAVHDLGDALALGLPGTWKATLAGPATCAI